MNSKLILPGESPKDAFGIREEVFVQEQGFRAESEFDQIDHTAHHVVLYKNGQPIACGRVFASEDASVWIIGRVAVLKEHRKTGTGRCLMRELEQACRQQGARTAELGAQVSARAFYEKCGYTAHGEIYLDEHCPHIKMRKPLLPLENV